MDSHYGYNFRAPRVDVHQFSMIPRAEIPRSTFVMQTQHKTTFSASLLIPVFVQEILPGDSISLSMTCFTRLSTPLYPIMDNMDLESFFFFVPNRLVWSHWQLFCGEQKTPGDSIAYSIPQIVSPASGFVAFSVYDYFGIPGVGQITGGDTISINALPLRAYGLIFNEWFRDENLSNPIGFGATGTPTDFGDGPDPYTNYSLAPVAKRHDYFTSCLPWTQKAATAVTLPLGTTATVKASTSQLITTAQPAAVAWAINNGSGVFSYPANNSAAIFATPATQNAPGGSPITAGTATGAAAGGGVGWTGLYPTNLYADLSTATAATINSIRLAFQTQKLLERDARGGTRYTEIIRSHFGVVSPDMRLQRPEYLGGGRTAVNIAPVPQTGQTGLTGGSTPLGTLGAVGTGVAHGHGFRYASTEHGYIIGVVTVRADPSYQQGVRKLWARSTRYDFYWPVFAMLGEQAVLNQEIYMTGTATDAQVFGYQERWAEYRYFPSMISGAFRSTYATPLDAWHLSQKYTALPALNSTFINDATATTLVRNLAAGAAANGEQFLADFFFNMKMARPMPMYSVPGLIDHF